MKNVLLVLALGLLGQNAFASGLSCVDFDHLNVKIESKNGHATAVFSDDRVQYGKKTIVVLHDVKVSVDEPSDFDVSFTGNVDLRRSDVRPGEYIGGTRLGELKTITVVARTIDGKEDKGDGYVEFTKRNGSKSFTQFYDCDVDPGFLPSRGPW